MFSYLPPELLEHIFDGLCPEALHEVCLCSRIFSAVAQPLLFRRISLDLYDPQTLRFLSAPPMHALTRFRHLVLENKSPRFAPPSDVGLVHRERLRHVRANESLGRLHKHQYTHWCGDLICPPDRCSTNLPKRKKFSQQLATFLGKFLEQLQILHVVVGPPYAPLYVFDDLKALHFPNLKEILLPPCISQRLGDFPMHHLGLRRLRLHIGSSELRRYMGPAEEGCGNLISSMCSGLHRFRDLTAFEGPALLLLRMIPPTTLTHLRLLDGPEAPALGQDPLLSLLEFLADAAIPLRHLDIWSSVRRHVALLKVVQSAGLPNTLRFLRLTQPQQNTNRFFPPSLWAACGSHPLTHVVLDEPLAFDPYRPPPLSVLKCNSDLVCPTLTVIEFSPAITSIRHSVPGTQTIYAGAACLGHFISFSFKFGISYGYLVYI
ncbi:hypothetical protein C8R43DRAFT_1212138 [Mycena crocata]|nr:hypothetical protein C8R43DRAFT_1212138 [Mycena crocata]